MANPSKQKGTEGENEIVAKLVAAGFPQADPSDAESVGVCRLEGGYELHDLKFQNMPGVDPQVEVKRRKVWHLFKWIPRIKALAGDRHWAIFAIHGDRNTKVGRGVREVMIVDADFGARLLHLFYVEHPMVVDNILVDMRVELDMANAYIADLEAERGGPLT